MRTKPDSFEELIAALNACISRHGRMRQSPVGSRGLELDGEHPDPAHRHPAVPDLAPRG